MSICSQAFSERDSCQEPQKKTAGVNPGCPLEMARPREPPSSRSGGLLSLWGFWDVCVAAAALPTTAQ